MRVHQLSELGGVEVTGVDLRQASSQQDRALRALFDEHGLVVFRDQTLTKHQLIAAADPFGGVLLNRPAEASDPEAPGLAILSSRGANGDVIPKDPDKPVGQVDWHTDDGYVVAPNRGKILYAVQVPEEGGLTGFIDGHRTYDALPADLKARIESLHVVQSWNKLREQFGDDRQYRLRGDEVLVADRFEDMSYGLVHAHPISGRLVLNLPRLWAAAIEELPGSKGQELMERLLAHITQPRFQYWHHYLPGDALIWDNWRFLHAASGTPGRFVRTMWSVTIRGGPLLGRVAVKSAA